VAARPDVEILQNIDTKTTGIVRRRGCRHLVFVANPTPEASRIFVYPATARQFLIWRKLLLAPTHIALDLPGPAAPAVGVIRPS
jgi:hypothetical protein